MSRKKKKAFPLRQTAYSMLALLLSFFILVLLNQAIGGGLPLPGTDEIDRALDALYRKAGISAQPASVQGDVRVHFIDVGQGDCALVQTPEKNLLIDAGDVGMGDLVADYLKAQGVQRLDFVLATHPHADHIGGMADVIEVFEVGRIIFSDIPDHLLPTTRVYERLLDAIAAKNLKLTRAYPGATYDLGEGVRMTILAPLEQYTEDLNEYSVVCRVDAGEASFLFTGDAGAVSEDDMVKQYGRSLAADVLKLGHHGSRTSTQSKWLNAVSPEIAVASLGWDNSYGHPHAQVLRRLEQHGITLYRTDLHGTVVVATDGHTYSVQTEK